MLLAIVPTAVYFLGSLQKECKKTETMPKIAGNFNLCPEILCPNVSFVVSTRHERT